MAERFVHEVRVGWADCDPARIVYTGRLVCIALEAIDAWLEARLGAGWYGLNLDRNVGTPFVHMTLDFRRPVTPRHRLDCEVRLLRYSGRSLRFAVRGVQDGELCFGGEFVEALVRADDYEGRREIPADIDRELRAAQESEVVD
jgi:4-hydroxybenzoyl-CoA thioesterase